MMKYDYTLVNWYYIGCGYANTSELDRTFTIKSNGPENVLSKYEGLNNHLFRKKRGYLT